MATSQADKGELIDFEPPHDSEAPRNKEIRWISFLLISSVTTLAPLWFFSYWGSLLGWPKVGFTLGFAAAGFALIPVLSRMLIYNPEWTAYVTQNPITGKNIPYGPGLHPSLFWEERNKEGNYSLKVITREFTVAVQTKTAQVTAKGMIQYAVCLQRILNFIGVDESTVNKGFDGFIQSFLLSRYAEKTAEEARAGIDDTNLALAVKFKEAEHEGMNVVEFEKKYGVTTVVVLLSTLELPSAAQKTRDSIDENANLFRAVAAMLGLEEAELKTQLADGKISRGEYEKYLNKAMATSENATMEIKAIEVNVPQLTPDVAQGVAAVAGLFARGGQGKQRKGNEPRKGATK